MNEEREDFVAKLALIAAEAKRVMDELPPGLTRDRMQHIVTISELLRARLYAGSSS